MNGPIPLAISRRGFLRAAAIVGGAAVVGGLKETRTALARWRNTLATGKLHPLWYSPLLPVFFFVSSIFAGLSMVIVECSLSHRIFKNPCDPADDARLGRPTVGLGKAASVVMFTYFGLKVAGREAATCPAAASYSTPENRPALRQTATPTSGLQCLPRC